MTVNINTIVTPMATSKLTVSGTIGAGVDSLVMGCWSISKGVAAGVGGVITGVERTWNRATNEG